jgi:hypothetical protein
MEQLELDLGLKPGVPVCSDEESAELAEFMGMGKAQAEAQAKVIDAARKFSYDRSTELRKDLIFDLESEIACTLGHLHEDVAMEWNHAILVENLSLQEDIRNHNSAMYLDLAKQKFIEAIAILQKVKYGKEIDLISNYQHTPSWELTDNEPDSF